MPIELDRDAGRGWLIARVTGDLAIDDVVTFLKTARAGVETRAIPLLVDASDATTSMSSADVDTAVLVVKNAVAAHGMRAHVALLASDDALFRWMFAYERACAEIGVPVIRAFRQRADAERWLAILSTAGRFQR